MNNEGNDGIRTKALWNKKFGLHNMEGRQEEHTKII